MAQSRASNPYVAGRPIAHEQEFFGRQELLCTVENELRSPERSTVVIFGSRRIGKTSLLLQLQRTLPSPSFLPVYFDLIGCGRKPLSRVLFEMASAIAHLVGTNAPSPQNFDEEGVFFRQVFLSELYGQLGEECRPVLLLDQFDELDMGSENQDDPAVGSVPLLSYLRLILESEVRLGFVIVVGHASAEGLSVEAKGIFKGARYERISVLEPKSAAGLVLLAEAQGSLSFHGAAVDRILDLTAGHPFFIQLLCQILWRRAHGEGPQGVPEVDVGSVEYAAARLIEVGESGLSWIWEGLPASERLVLAAMAPISGDSGDGTDVSPGQMAEILQRHGSSPPLANGEMLRKSNDGYRVEVELMRRWIAARRPLSVVREELERMNPLAVMLYESGKSLFRQGDSASAVDLLRHALRIEPGHLKARLLLCAVLLQLGQFAEAVQMAEVAYRYDRDLALDTLVQLLLLRADELHRGGDLSQALETLRRVLEVAPQNAVAHEAVGLRAKREREKIAAEAQKHVWEEAWVQAVALYQRLVDEDGEESRWQKGLMRARAELDLCEKYAEGKHALEEGQGQQAVCLLASVVSARQDYKDAARLLTEALLMDKNAAASPVKPPLPTGRRLAWPLILAGALCFGGLSVLAAKRGAKAG